MFSGITNQVSSWMGSAKGEQEEQVPTPTEDGAAVISPEEKKDTSPTKHSKLDVLTNVKNQFGGWLGSGIPKFRKGEGDQGDSDETRPIGEEGEVPVSEKSVKGSPAEQKDDDDNSSATGGADSNPVSASGTPTEEKDGQFGAVSNKALAGAKSIGSFLYSAVNKAGKTVSEASAKIKKTVEENSILGEFNREQDAFVKGKQGSNSDAAVPPWVGCANEESLKEECLSLSTDRRNFVRSPPAGVDFQFDYDISYPIAIATMTEDPNLEKMRFELVPKVISEENFWRNYFYRVSLICQANELSYMGREGENQLTDIGNADSQQLETETHTESSVAATEFISDTFQASSNDIVQVEEDVKRIALMNRETTEEEWEKELEAELQDYEVVADTDSTTATNLKLSNVRNDFWDKDIDAMLDEDQLAFEQANMDTVAAAGTVPSAVETADDAKNDLDLCKSEKMETNPCSTAAITYGDTAEQSATSVNSVTDQNRTVDTTNVVETNEPVVNTEIKDEVTELDVKPNCDDSDTKCETDVVSAELDCTSNTGELDVKLQDTSNSADDSDVQEPLTTVTDTTTNVTSAEPDVPAKDNTDTDEPTDTLCNGPKEEVTEPPPADTATDEEAMLVDDKSVLVEQSDTGDDSLNKSPPSQECDMNVDDGAEAEAEDQPIASADCTMSEIDDQSLDHDMEQEKPVFVHVSTKSDNDVEGDGDGDCDKTSMNAHVDMQGEAAEEDPIGISHDGVKDDDTLLDFTEESVDKESVPIKVVDFNDETITSDKSVIEEELVASKGADEELCIIPDTEREISQEEKDAATAAAAAAAETPRSLTEHIDADHSGSTAIDNQSKTNQFNADSSVEQSVLAEKQSDESNVSKETDDTAQSVADAGVNDEQTDTTPKSKDVDKQIRVTDLPESEAPEKSCPQCSEIRKCKYKVNYMDEIRHMCSEACVSSFRKDHMCVPPTEIPDQSTPEAANKTTPMVAQPNKVFVRKCGECTLQILQSDNKTLSWETMDFCGEDCLSKYQNRIGSHCANCKKSVQMSSLGKYCVRFGHDIRQFCCSLCLEEFKKGLKVCSYCQKDISAGTEGFLAPVGDKGQFKDFCSQLCMEKYDQMSNKNAKKSNLVDITQCSVCAKEKQVQVLYDQFEKKHKFCGEPCFVAFKFVNVSNPVQCDMCKKYFENENTTEFSIFYDNAVRNFCCKTCQNIYIIANRRIVPCSWCKVKKYNFDMIKKTCHTGQILMMCSLNCLSLFQVSINAVCSKKTKCDHCLKMTTAMYHLTMSDATIRNFCTYHCVMAFQNQFAKVPITISSSSGSNSVSSISSSPAEDKHSNSKTTVVPASGPKRYQTRVSRSLVTDAGNEVQMPVITNVQSLANTTNGLTPVTIPVNNRLNTININNQLTQPQPATTPPKHQVKQQVIVRAPPYPAMRNAGTWCKPILHTKGVSCRPHPANKETQTEQIKEKTVFVPVPVPIYVPSPMPMFSAPIPVPIPFPLPIPVPIFIPTTRNSAAGIMKEIKKIQVKIPTDPFEAELLMMAEMVAGEKKVDNTDSESDEDDNAGSAADGGFSPEAVDTSNTFGDDMLQMALKMATELDEPAVDLEGALTANTITASQSQDTTVVSTEESVDDPQPMHQLIDRQALRGRKRAHRPARNINPSKRGRRMSSHVEMPLLPPPQPQQPPEPIEKPDANMCLKYTFGVNAWKQWVTTKNAELEKSSRRVKLFKNEILQLTADELNYSLCLFVKEVRKPNGTEYAPDTIYYLCLGIQQYLFENGRIDNIFTDAYYEKFTDCLDEVARKFSVLYNDSHYIVTRVEEEHLWESKQLGAHSPHVLLSTLMFFNTKHFNLTTVDEHMQLSFSHIMKHWKRNANQPPGSAKMPGSRNVLLRFYPPQTTLDANSRKKKVYEQQENEDNPLRCPVKLYEFYLSKCPESVKTRNDVFYLLPERSCVPDSPVWYSTMALGREALEKMLHRVKMVKEINVALLTS